jgi:hypothetical protein
MIWAYLEIGVFTEPSLQLNYMNTKLQEPGERIGVMTQKPVE